MATSRTTEIQSTAQFDGVVKGMAPGQLIVIDFHAVWCGPCKFIAPVIEKLADKYTEVVFVKIDVDKQKELATRYKVSAMPTFKFIKDGDVIDELRGASPPQLANLVAKHCGRDPNVPDEQPLDLSQYQQPGMPPIQKIILLAVVAYYVYKWWSSK